MPMHFPLPSRKPTTHDTTNAADFKSILTSLLPFLQGFHTNPHPHHDDSTNPNQSDPFFDDGYGSGFTEESPLKVSWPPCMSVFHPPCHSFSTKLRSSPRCTHVYSHCAGDIPIAVHQRHENSNTYFWRSAYPSPSSSAWKNNNTSIPHQPCQASVAARRGVHVAVPRPVPRVLTWPPVARC